MKPNPKKGDNEYSFTETETRCFYYKPLVRLRPFAECYNYKNLREYEYYMAYKIDQICNSKTAKEDPDNGEHNPKNE